MKLIHGLILTLTLSLSLGAAEPTSPAPTDPAATPVAPAPTEIVADPAAEVTPPKQAPVKAKAAVKKKAKAKAIAKKPDTQTDIIPAESAVVKRENSNVRGKPSFAGEVITKLKKGEPVTLQEEITLGSTKKDEPARWFRIAMPANTPVWVSAHFVDPTTKLVLPKKLQVRSGPGENYSVIGLVTKDTSVKQIRQVNDWLEIETPAETYAYIAADLIDRSAPTATPAPEPSPEVVSVPPDVSNVPTPAEPPAAVVPATPEPARPEVTPEPPIVVTPPPVVEEPLPKRIVTRQGIIRRSYNVQTPSYYEMESPDTGKIVNYLYSPQPDFTLKEYIGQTVTVTGEEYVDKRWPQTPVIEIESLEQQ